MPTVLIFVLLFLCSICSGATIYVNGTTGNNAKAAANGYAYTASTKTIAKTDAFLYYTYHAGDQLQVTVTGASSKVDVGFYTIASKVDKDSVTLTTDASGSNEDDTNVTLAFGNNGSTATTAVGTLNGPCRNVYGATLRVTGDGDVIQLAAGTNDNSGAVLAYAYCNVGYSYTIQGATSTASETTLLGIAGQNYTVRVDNTNNSKTITFRNLTIASATTNALLYVDGDCNTAIVIDNCVLNATGANSYCGYWSSASGTGRGSLTMYDSTATTGGAAKAFDLIDLNALDFDNCTITGGTGGGIYVTADSATVDVNDCTVNAGGGYCIEGDFSAAVTSFVVTDSEVTNTDGHGIVVLDYAGTATITGNTVTTTDTTAAYGIAVGTDNQVTDNPIGNCLIANNSITQNGNAQHHCLLIGGNCNNARVRNNTIVGDDESTLGMVIKGNNCDIEYNDITAGTGIFVKGGAYNWIKHNTLVCDGAYAGDAASCLKFDTDTDDAHYNVAEENSCVTTGDYAVQWTSDTDANYTRLDYNYYTAATYDFYVGGFEYSLSGMITQWASAVFTDNDAHSADSAILGPATMSVGNISGDVAAAVANILSTATIVGNTGTYVLPDPNFILSQETYGVSDGSSGLYGVSQRWRSRIRR